MSTVPETVKKLARDDGDDSGFTRAQLTRAVSALRQMAPGIEVLALHMYVCADPPDEHTVLSFECAGDEAIALLSLGCVPIWPARGKHGHCPGFYDVERVRGGRMHIQAHIRADARGPLAAFAPIAIRLLAPEGPDTRGAYKELVREELNDAFRFCRRVIEDRLRQSDVSHLVALYSRLHAETAQAILGAFDMALVEEPGRRSSQALHLVVSNDAGGRDGETRS